jgi:hypothetical protein
MRIMGYDAMPELAAARGADAVPHGLLREPPLEGA